MYHFIFYFIYKTQTNQKERGPKDGKFLGSALVAVVIFFQLALFYAVARYFLKKYFQIDMSFSMGKTSNERKLVFFPFFLLVFFLIFKLYNEQKISQLLKHYETTKIFSFINIVKFFFIFFLPLALLIFFIKRFY